MSTYLLAWAVGDFEFVEDFTRRKYQGRRLPVRVYTTKGLKEQGRFALENAHRILDFYSEVCEAPLVLLLISQRKLKRLRRSLSNTLYQSLTCLLSMNL